MNTELSREISVHNVIMQKSYCLLAFFFFFFWVFLLADVASMSWEVKKKKKERIYDKTVKYIMFFFLS